MFTSNGFQPTSVEYLQQGCLYRTRIRQVRVVQVAEQNQVIDKLVFDLDVSGVKSPRPNSISFKSRPETNEKNAQVRWDERWTRFKEIYGIDIMDENYNGWVGRIGELSVGSYRDTLFFELPVKKAGEPQSAQHPVSQNAQQQYAPAQPVASLDDIPF